MNLREEPAMKALLKGEFEQSVLRSAYARIHDYNDPLRGPVFALLMRELIRIVMGRIAPDVEVTKASWCKGEPWLYKAAKSGNDMVTRRGRYRFAITGTISDAKIQQYPKLNCAEAIKELGDLVTVLSEFAHVSPGTYNQSEKESDAFLSGVESVVSTYAKKLLATKEYVRNIVYELVSEELTENVKSAIPEELLAVSANTRVIAVHIEELEDFDTSSMCPVLSGSGTADVDFDTKCVHYPDDSCPVKFSVSIDPNSFDVDVLFVDVDTRLFFR